MWEFLSSDKAPWIIAILASAIGGLWALHKWRIEKKLEKFNKINVDLFNKDDKQVVLAAVSTLGIFKKSRSYETHVTDVLLSRLYTELDYDVTNAIAKTLIQDSNQGELIMIANGISDINRNFFTQHFALKQRIEDLNKELKKDPPDPDMDAAQIAQLTKEKKELLNRHRVLLWHKQVTADAYASTMRKAYLEKRKKEIRMYLYQNDFNYAYWAQFKATDCEISRSALSSSTLVDLTFCNVDIFQTYFDYAAFHRCKIENGVIRESSFKGCNFTDTIFKNIDFDSTDFYGCQFVNTKFIDCKNLLSADFEGSQADASTVLPANVYLKTKTDIETEKIKTSGELTIKEAL